MAEGRLRASWAQASTVAAEVANLRIVVMNFLGAKPKIAFMGPKDFNPFAEQKAKEKEETPLPGRIRLTGATIGLLDKVSVEKGKGKS